MFRGPWRMWRTMNTVQRALVRQAVCRKRCAPLGPPVLKHNNGEHIENARKHCRQPAHLDDVFPTWQ